MTTVEHLDDLADNGSAWWLRIDQWAAELGITRPHAVAEASMSPEDRAAMRRVRVILPEPGAVGYLLDLESATGKAAVRIDGVTITMDACRRQDRETGAALAAGEDGDGLTRSERASFIDMMAPDEVRVLLAYVTGYSPEVFDHAPGPQDAQQDGARPDDGFLS